MELEVICDPGRLLQFEPEWSAFARSQTQATPFQLPDWLIPWWQHFGSGWLRVFVFREPDCVGVLPCFLHDWNGSRQLTLIGSGISDYLDPLFVELHETAILNCLREYLAVRDEWDVCDWQDLSYNTPLARLFPRLWKLEKRDEVPCSETTLEGSFDEFWKQRPRHVRRNVRRYRDKARQNGSLEFEVTSEADEDLLGALIRLHAARWSVHGQPGMIEANHSAAFLVDVSRRFAAKDMLWLFGFRYQGEIAAVHLVFRYRNTIYGYLTGFDPALSQFALSSVLLAESLRECYGQGFGSWNFCRGDEPYKHDWGAQPIKRCRVVVNRF